MSQTRYLEPTQESGRSFVMRKIAGEVVMLNLLRFRDAADYSATPHLVRQRSVEAFLSFASHSDYLAGIGHRTAALEDSRLLPLQQLQTGLMSTLPADQVV